MSLAFGILGLLNYRDSTGYDLTKIFADSLNNFWHAQSSQIYRELNRMEEAGLVASRSIIQNGRPNKRLYSITDAGRAALSEWLCEAKPEIENPHHPMLVRVFFGANDPEATLAMLKKYREQCLRMLETNYAGIRQNIENYAAIIPDGQEKSKYWLMTLDCGIAQTQAMADWAEHCIVQIEKEMA
ncbi:PadR family transcriptional regulator [Desulfotomaculum sp. 1211_IL3151]|uniref:PadR family transcriptional regulator n=1 Tax=Desulfotomaculum sp. 1211_IL3151 TaxID=3084055 RepID=UPI002FDB86FE